jgi:hypothetical protein
MTARGDRLTEAQGHKSRGTETSCRH